MNATVQRDPWRMLSLVSTLLLLLAVARYGADAGMIWDEPLQAEYGNRILAWFRSGFTDRTATTYEDLYLYGGLFELIAQWIAEHSPGGLYETRHVLTALLAVVAIVVTGATASLISGPRSGFLAGLMLALTPAWIGHGLFNPKDIPFGTLAIAVIWAAVRIATGPLPLSWRDASIASALLGLALAVRPGGVFLVLVPFVAVLAAAFLRDHAAAVVTHRPAARHHALTGIARLTATLPIAWVLMLMAWPWAQLSPLSGPIAAMRAASRFSWDGTMLFAGQMVSSTDLPASYLPTWFAITTPETYALALLMGAGALTWYGAPLSRTASSGLITVAMAAAGPPIAALLTRPVLYDGLRHFLFLFPPLAVLAGVSVDTFMTAARPPAVRALGLATFALAAALTLRDIIALHPYQYVYFNRLFGGTMAAAGRYETDYWGASYREGFAWVATHVSRLAEKGPTRMASCNDNSNRRLDYYRRRSTVAEQVAIAPDYASADVYLAVTRYDCHKRPGQILHVVERAGAPLLYVIRPEPK